MSLVVKVQINDTRIGTVTARRMSGESEPDAWCTYDYRVFENYPTTVVTLARGEIRHRYGDGVWALLQKVIDAADLAPMSIRPTQQEESE